MTPFRRRSFDARTPRRAGYLEEYEQREVVARMRRDPRFEKLAWFAPPSGAKLSETQAKLMKANGMQRGVPDLLICAPSQDGRYAGLALEFKSPTGKGRITPEQIAFAGKLTVAGWRCEFPINRHEAWGIICEYFNLPKDAL